MFCTYYVILCFLIIHLFSKLGFHDNIRKWTNSVIGHSVASRSIHSFEFYTSSSNFNAIACSTDITFKQPPHLPRVSSGAKPTLIHQHRKSLWQSKNGTLTTQPITLARGFSTLSRRSPRYTRSMHSPQFTRPIVYTSPSRKNFPACR